MKCDNLIGRTFNGEVYVLASEAMEAIAELKKKLMPCLNGDCILTCEVVEKYGKENAELKQKLEDAKATAYAESIDVGMRERRLRRALWIARAEWARSSALSYHLIESHPDKDVSATYKRKANSASPSATLITDDSTKSKNSTTKPSSNTKRLTT
jgi:hypothetical protein